MLCATNAGAGDDGILNINLVSSITLGVAFGIFFKIEIRKKEEKNVNLMKINAVMNTTAIRRRLSNFMQTADEKKIKGLYALLEDDIQEGERISIAQYNREIDAAMEEVKKGEVYSHEEVVQMSKKW